MIKVFFSVFVRCYFPLIFAVLLGVIVKRIEFAFRFFKDFGYLLGWHILFEPFSSLELKLIFIPMFFVSLVLAFLAAMAYKKNLSGRKIVEHHNFAQKSDKSSLKEWLTIIVGLILYYFYLNYF